MLKLNRIAWSPGLEQRRAALEDRTIFQTPEWVRFVSQTQSAEPVYAEVLDGATVAGYFTGLMFSRFGVRVLGSPFPGWTTMYMGFNLRPETPRWLALAALPKFAFSELGCLHLEVGDPWLTPPDGDRCGIGYAMFDSWESDLRRSEDELFAAMASACRRCIRKAEKTGLTVHEVLPGDAAFPAEYYEQLRDVFAKQGKVPTYGRDRVESLIANLHPTGSLLLLRARDPEGRCVATGIYSGYHRLAQFWGNASFQWGQQWRPNEALHWYAMRYWKQRGREVFDWGGGGGYKEKYGCAAVRKPLFHCSRYRFLWTLRNQAQRVRQVADQARARLGMHRSKGEAR